LNEESIQEFSKSAYAKSNIAVVANGASQADLTKWVGEFFTQTPSGSAISGEATKYYGGEERIAHASGNSLVLAFPGSSSFTSGSSYKPEIGVLAALLGGKSSIKWSPGFSLLSKAASSFPGASALATHFAYSDAGLLTIQFSGSAQAIRNASTEAVKYLKSISEGSISKEDFTKAVAFAKYQALEEGQNVEAGLVSTGAGLIHGGKPFQIDEISKSVEGVSIEKLKAVCISQSIHPTSKSNIYIGCQGASGGQSNSLGCWRLICPSVRRRNWSQGIKGLGFGESKMGLYQQLLECIVDIREFHCFKCILFHPASEIST
jgi:ubiquinol-cytochrome c reductase core subunit 2